MILDYKGIQIFYEDSGKGKTVLLLHGFLENSSMWNDLVPLISQTNRVITIDLLGHGQTGCLGYIHTMEMMAEAVYSVLNHLNIKDILVIGHSMGGYVALALTDLFPDLVSGFCLMNSTAQADSNDKKINRDRAIKIVKQDHKAFISMSISNLFAPKNRNRLINEINQVKEEALKMELQGIIAALEGMKIRKDRSYLLEKPSIKKMVIMGQNDPVLDYNSIKKQLIGLDVEIVEFPDGHMSHIENNIELSYKLMHFIEK